MKTIWIATSNQHKVEEFKKMLPEYNVKCLKDLNQKIKIIENGTTFEENAICKAKSLYDVLHQPVISDDSGIEVDAMDKKPGVYSARWMGENTSYEIKNKAIIDAVKGKVKTARYVCVIAYIDEMGNAHTYRGEVEGQIHSCPVGENGFGYDPIFLPEGYTQTFAEMGNEVKNNISHRAKAVEKLAEFLFFN